MLNKSVTNLGIPLLLLWTKKGHLINMYALDSDKGWLKLGVSR